MTEQLEENKPATMSSEEVSVAASKMMRQMQYNSGIAFYDHWLTKLGLDPVVKRLDKAREDRRKN